ncbi:L,D-transpeptidase family protein [Streptomyces pacificus]|uniref:L,D-transpeptidase family protein n=1 Tax=Streptomyces pacificus TaxID=2705029 RepID=A0A6A0AUH1_9ACTN|nr:L,D-transpeptidase family protein [Streptomyces pacificus]GFH36013.1 L,D-transpeptidase family protein [Streptomyces pacificus]
MHRTSVLRGPLPVLLTLALTLTAGCTGRPADGGSEEPPAVPAAPGGPSAAPLATAAPAADDAKPPAPSTDGARPSTPAAGDAEPPDPSPGTPEARTPEPEVLMAEGSESEQVRELQARLRQIGHFHRSPTAFYGSMTAGAVSGFQRKRGLTETGSVDETTWRRLLGLTRTPTADELRPATTNELDAPDPRCLEGRVLCISKESRTLAWMIDGRVVAAMDVRFGSENTPTREGTFSVDRKAEAWVSTLYDTPMPYSMFFSGGQAVHYSSDFAARGYDGASHGCVNVRDKKKLASVFGQVKVGDKVVVHW